MKTGIATVSISGSLVDKLHAAANAGFDGVEIFENDLTQSDLSPRQVRQLAESLGLEIIALQPFRNFEAMPEAIRKQNFYQARKKFELMHELGTSRLMVCSNVSPHVIDDPARAAADLHQLAELAAQENFQIGYEALAWGRYVHDYDQAWDIVKQADHGNLGIVLDTFHMYARNNTLDTMRNEITADKIALVQLADAPSLQMDVLNFSRHFRCFPGQGDMPIIEFMQCLKEKGYRDYISHEIFNDEFRASLASEKATDGMRSLIWLGEQLKEPEVPEPTIDSLAFIEFAIEGEDGQKLVNLLQQLGFAITHRHRSKKVDLMRQGKINLVLNYEPQSQAHHYFLSHGVSVCALGFGTSSVAQMIKRTKHYDCARFNNQAGPGELNIPAIKGVGDQLIYFVDSQSVPEFYDIDFVPVSDPNHAHAGAGLREFDHVGQTVLDTDMLSATFFFKALFGFDIEPSQDMTDINGLVTSRVAKSPAGNIRMPFNTSSARNSSAQRFVNQAQGAGVQQIAFNCDDIFATVQQVSRDCILPIPANYYRDLEARFQLDTELLALMQEYHILYDQNEEGHFFHFYTTEHFGVFFEVVQRVNYQGYGEPNAHIRLAAQARQQRIGN
ncbi:MULTISPECIES: bifunctional sugar phosphate isomerase/epimerase/4-hydroxyphenylpyruvate dioxygenase family protein [Vibrio]|uniref:3-dehydroshikimate dehydratase n=1 Tax=Vibrio ostreae TaxID=2841925 RepID=A0A975UAF5_9VIBR|nr:MULTISPECIES: sugar phosphate isomerase/epimerase and 4-hydroxyphenylpyruvate domain-containing protein [Vibrio]QXO18193.1 sugar phosphate isomerase/epimerase and 4-hydroxyphenylpyruvate domain-containing protein [Vibrio ostreae]WGY47483.1 sugar phosphate isomerase/epimerase and 4-hydroxyphenylpyruvate domain-containing protein [Vibrio sp. ABG19]